MMQINPWSPNQMQTALDRFNFNGINIPEDLNKIGMLKQETFLTESGNMMFFEMLGSLRHHVAEVGLEGIFERKCEKLEEFPDLQKVVKTFSVLGEYLPFKKKIVYYTQAPELEIVKIHERYHTMHHLWPDTSNTIWQDFGTVDDYYLELLAQLFTYSFCRDNHILLQEFKKMTQTQPLIYNTWKIFQDLSGDEIIRLYWLIRERKEKGQPLGMIDQIAKVICNRPKKRNRGKTVSTIPISKAPGIKEYEALIDGAEKELNNIAGWQQRWKKYGEAIISKKNDVCDEYNKFRGWKGLRRYISVSSVLRPHAEFSVRFKGQQVGTISVNKGIAYLNTKKQSFSNSRDFGFKEKPQKIPWKNARSFRDYIGNWSGNKYSEHMIEALAIEEMENSAIAKFNGSFSRIQPVRLYNKLPFQMPVPLSGYRGFPKPSKKGSIDILARMGFGRGTRLWVIELKKEGKNNSDRPIAQALIYTVCIANLLLNDNNWWNIFGFKGILPKILNLAAVAMLPVNRANEYDEEFKNLELPSNKKSQRESEIIMNGHQNVRITVRPFFYRQKGSTITIV